MEVTFINPGVDYMIQSIMHFQTEGEAEFWSEPLYYFYPQLDRTFAASLPVAERRDYIERTMRVAYAELKNTICLLYTSQLYKLFLIFPYNFLILIYLPIGSNT